MALLDEKMAINKRCRMSELMQVIIVDYPSRRVKGGGHLVCAEGALNLFGESIPFAEFLCFGAYGLPLTLFEATHG